MRNREGLVQFDIEWGWASGKLETGFTAVLRVKDEALNLPFVLPPLLRSLAHVLVIDNGSTDGTPEVARQVAAAIDAGDRLEVVEYPFAVSRCGSEHLNTPADSVHSLTYFYNWAFSQVRTTYTLKWDGDMVLTGEGEHIFQDLTWQLQGQRRRLYMMRVPLYVESERRAYADTAFRPFETWGWPNAEGYTFGKGIEWEFIRFPPDLARHTLPDGACFEVKWLEADEFSNWSELEFDDTPRIARKLREWEVFTGLQDGRQVDELVPFYSENEHVIEAARRITTPEWRAMGIARPSPAMESGEARP